MSASEEAGSGEASRFALTSAGPEKPTTTSPHSRRWPASPNLAPAMTSLGETLGADDAQYVVEVEDQCLDGLAGHSGCSYASPPQPAAQALALVRALLSCPQARLSTDQSSWWRAIAGGRRTVWLHRALADGQLTVQRVPRADAPDSGRPSQALPAKEA
jgi:hypothetical protein